jgi:hypothetical protein
MVVWSLNVFYYKSHVLKEPVFVKHYYDLREGMDRITLYYIQNINDNETITDITIPELGDDYIVFNENTHNTDDKYYKLKSITIMLNKGKENTYFNKYKDKIITKAIVNFSRGKTLFVDVGKIYLYNTQNKSPVSVTTNYASGSSDYTGSSSYALDKEMDIVGIYCRFTELIGNGINIEINDKKFSELKFPIRMKAGETLNVKYSLNFNKEDIRRSYVYDFPIDIGTVDIYGNIGHASLYINYWLQFPEQYDIKRLINSERGQ